MDEFQNKRITVAGLGRFGGSIAAAKWLCGQGARVTVTDTAPAEKLEGSIRQLEGQEVRFHLGGHLMEDFTQADLVVASPAIAPTSEYLSAARQSGVAVTTEICLFVERCRLPIVAVSGTKGKSTTSALLARMLQSPYTCWLGGNIGKSLLPDLPQMREGEVVLLELSSFMLEYLGRNGFAPHVAVMTMLESDHLEWHGSQGAYLAAKGKLVVAQGAEDFAVLGEDCAIAREFAGQTRAKVIWYGLEDRRRFELKIPGEHNQLNAQAAFAAASVMGVSFEAAQAAVADFAGLPHRLELVHEQNRIRFYNDSIATIPAAAAAALASFPAGRVIQIIGGHDKGLAYDPMCDAIAKRAKAALCIGEATEKIETCLRARHPGYAAFHRAETLEGAMGIARKLAEAGDVVLLSTGCSSYDQFVNFEQRGERFAELARQMEWGGCD